MKNGYDVQAIDWFLEQLRLDHRNPAGMNQDPWRDLAVTAQFTRTEIGDLAGATTRKARRELQQYYAEKCRKARGRDFEELPGVRLRWEWTGVTRRELRTQDKQAIVYCRGVSRLTFDSAGRKLVLLGTTSLTRRRFLCTARTSITPARQEFLSCTPWESISTVIPVAQSGSPIRDASSFRYRQLNEGMRS